MSDLTDLPNAILQVALNEGVFIPGVVEVDAEPQAKGETAVAYFTNYEGDQIRVTAEYVEEVAADAV